MRDDFSAKIKKELSARAGHCCSVCGKSTSGPGTASGSVISDGVAAHITAASPKGPRFDFSLSPVQRCAADNGIWVCSQHGREIDSDELGYSADALRGLKRAREAAAAQEIQTRDGTNDCSARLIELPGASSKHELFDIISPQTYVHSTTSAVRQLAKHAQKPLHLLDLAAELIVETWDSYPETAGILSTMLSTSIMVWNPQVVVLDKLQSLCEREVDSDDWSRIAVVEPIAFALGAKGRAEIHKKVLERMIINPKWRKADAERVRNYYGALGVEMASIIRHWNDDPRQGLLRANDVSRVMDLLLSEKGVVVREKIRESLLDLLWRQAELIRRRGENKLAKNVVEIARGLDYETRK